LNKIHQVFCLNINPGRRLKYTISDLQVLNGKITESKKAKEDASNGKPSESVSSVNKENSPADAGEQKPLEENGVVNEAAGDALKPANGIANGC